MGLRRAARPGILLASALSAAMAVALALEARPLLAAQAADAVSSRIGTADGPRIDSIRCAPRIGEASAVAIIDFNGGIEAGYDSDGVYTMLNRIAGDASVGAVALRIDSSGGESYSAKKHYEALAKLKSECRLPAAAFIGNVGTSGGFWLAMAADEVHADPLSTIGAVGVLAVFENEREKREKEGIHTTVIRTGDRKWPLMPYLPVEERDVGKIRDSLALVLDEFVSAVERARGAKLKLARDALTTGEAWMGREALALGLVDPPEELDRVAERLIGRTPSAYKRFDLARSAGFGSVDEEPSGQPAVASWSPRPSWR